MKWILHSDVIELYLSGQDSTSNPFGITQVSLSLSLSLYICVCVCGGLLSEGFEPEFFLLNFNPPILKYKIHSIEVDLHYFEAFKNKNSCHSNFFSYSSSLRKVDD